MKLIRLFLLLLALATVASAQSSGPATTIRFGTADPASCTPGGANIFYRTDTGQLKTCTAVNTWTVVGAGAGSGDVTGPASATDNAVVRFDGAGGKTLQNSAVTIADTSGDITGGKYNGLTITTSTGTLTIPNGVVVTGPSATATLPGLGLANTFTGANGFSSYLEFVASATPADPTGSSLRLYNKAGALTLRFADSTESVLGAGITSLNTLTVPSQIFSNSNDTNVTLAISSLIGEHIFSLGWTGTLAAGRGGTGLSSLGTGVATFLGTPSSANLLTAVTDETGTGAAVFGTSPAITTSLTTGSTTFALLNTTATTINFAGAATTLNIGSSSTNVKVGTAAGFTTLILDLQGGTTNSNLFLRNNAATTASAITLADSSASTLGNFAYAGNTNDWLTGTVQGDIIVKNQAAKSLILATNNTRQMFINSSGQVVITDANTAANANGLLNLSTSADGKVIAFNSTTTNALGLAWYNSSNIRTAVVGQARANGAWITGAVASDFVINNLTASAIIFGINDAEKARLDSSGNLIVGGDVGIARNAANVLEVNTGVAGTFASLKLLKITSYNNTTTTGLGVPVVVASTRVTAQTAANASISTFTVGAADGSFEISANMNVTAATTLVTTLTCTYTDESNTARTMIFPVTQLSGSFIAAGAITGTGAWETSVIHIRAKAATAITILTSTGTFTSVTYTAEGIIKQTS